MSNYKRLFLEGHSYYLTFVTYERNPILIENIELLRESFRESKKYFNYKIDAIVILPDHVHMIITPKNSLDYPKIIQAIKYNFSKRYEERDEFFQSHSRNKRKMRAVWQRRYYEHTIRDEKDWLEKMDYMRTNPIKHKLVENLKDWQYSSFSR